MEVFRAPRVSLIARPEFLEPEHLRVQWQGSASAGERLAEFAGRICYMSQHNPANRSTADYLENIKKQGHGSVLEHAVYVLLRSEEHTSELQSLAYLVCRLLLEKKKKDNIDQPTANTSSSSSNLAAHAQVSIQT